MKKNIQYAGSRCVFQEQVKNINEAQSIIDGWRRLGLKATATHKGEKHQIYVETLCKEGQNEI